MDCGEGVGRISPPCGREVDGPGDADKDPALKGWKEAEGRLAIAMPCKGFEEGLVICVGRGLGVEPTGGEFASEPMVLAARRAEIGLEPRGGASPWNVDRLP
jgi:hypothetical protein